MPLQAVTFLINGCWEPPCGVGEALLVRVALLSMVWRWLERTRSAVPGVWFVPRGGLLMVFARVGWPWGDLRSWSYFFPAATKSKITSRVHAFSLFLFFLSCVSLFSGKTGDRPHECWILPVDKVASIRTNYGRSRTNYGLVGQITGAIHRPIRTNYGRYPQISGKNGPFSRANYGLVRQ